MNEHVNQMCELALCFLLITNEQKKENYENINFSDEDFKLAAADIIYSLQHFAKTGEQKFFARDKTQYMMQIAMKQIQ